MLDYANKKTFVLTPAHLECILNLEPSRPFNKNLDEDGEVAFYRANDDSTENVDVSRVLKIQRQDDTKWII